MKWRDDTREPGSVFGSRSVPPPQPGCRMKKLHCMVRPNDPTIGEDTFTPLIETMPGKRVRINPRAVPDLACWLLTVGLEFEAILKKTHRGLNEEQRAELRGLKAAARLRLSTVSILLDRMLQTTDADAFDKVFVDWTQEVKRLEELTQTDPDDESKPRYHSTHR